MTFDEIITRIEGGFARLSPQLRRAARYIIDHPDDVALYSMRQLAAQADVHPSTMVRLARELGFDGHASFQQPFQERLRSRPKVSYAGDARDLQQRGDEANANILVTEMFEAERRSMTTLIERVGSERIAQAAKVLRGADTIFVVGSRSLYAVAHYFHYASRMFTHNVVLVDGLGGTFADQLRGIGADDVVLATSFSPYSRDTVRAANYALERGARIVSITDSAVSPLALGDDTITLVAPNDSPSFFHSIVPAMAVAEALVMLMIAQGGDQALAELALSEEQLNGFEAYWLEKGGRARRA